MQFEDPILTVEVAGDRVAVCGEVDMSTAPLMEQALIECLRNGWVDLTIDLSGVTYFDSSGIQVMLQTYRKLNERSGCLHVTGLNDHTKRIFKLIGLERMFVIEQCC